MIENLFSRYHKAVREAKLAEDARLADKDRSQATYWAVAYAKDREEKAATALREAAWETPHADEVPVDRMTL